jgi:predicted MFS family arabinose efflux permease
MASLLIGLMIFASAGITIGSTGVDALFFARFGPQNLPYMYLALGVTNFIGMLGVTALIGRVAHHRLFIFIPFVFAIVLIIERVVLGLNLPWFMPIVWLLKELMNLVQGTYTWGLAGPSPILVKRNAYSRSSLPDRSSARSPDRLPRRCS